MAAVIANLAAGVSGPCAPQLLVGTGRDKRQLVVVATADRGLAGGFNSRSSAPRASRSPALIAEGKDVKIITVGKKAPRPAAPRLRRPHRRKLRSRPARRQASALAQPIADQVLELFEAGEVDVVTLFYSRFKSVVTQIPTAKQLIPAEVAEARRPIDLKGAVYEYEPDEETILADAAAAQHHRPDPRRHAGEPGRLLRRPDGRHGQRHPQRRRHDRRPHHPMNRTRQAQITKELIEIISGAEAL